MGCGSSSSVAGPTTKVDKIETGPTAEGSDGLKDTWATKSDLPKATGSLVTADQAQRASTTHNDVVIMSDDGEDGIRVEATSPDSGAGGGAMMGIVPAAPAGGARPASTGRRGEGATASPNDPLQAVSEDSPTVQPLPRQQQEEAAKLAETRKRFDNQRYHQPGVVKGQSTTSLFVHVGDSTSPAPPGSTPQAQGGAGIVGLSLNTSTSPGAGAGTLPEWDLPGGILEEVEEPQQPVMTKKDRIDSRWSNASKKAFDDEDEALMAEILDDADACI